MSDLILNYHYIKARDDFSRCLFDWSDALQEDPELANDVCEILDRFTPQLDLLKAFGDEPPASRCFKHRCQVIKFTIEDVSSLLIAKTETVSDLAEVIGMIGIQIGRLVLLHENREDRTVMASEGMASALIAWMDSTIAVTAGSFSPFVRSMWQCLHFSVGECSCRQCRTLRGTPTR